MKVREKSRALSVIEFICHMAFIYPIIAFIWYLFADSSATKISVFLWVALSEVFMYMLRRRLQRDWKQYGVLVIYIALLALFINEFGGVYLCAGIAIAVLHLIIIWMNSVVDLEVPSVLVAVLLFVIGIGVWLLSATKILYIFYIGEFVYAFGIVIYKNLKSANDFIWENRRTAFLSAEQIQNANYLVTFVLGVIILAVSTVCGVLFSPMLSLLKQPIINFLYKCFGVNVTPLAEGAFVKIEDEEIGEIADLPEKVEPGSVIAGIILGIIAIIAIVIVVIFIIRIIKLLSSDTADGDIKEYIIPFHHEEVSSVEKKEEEKTDDRPAKRIRRIYKKKIKSNLKKYESVPKSSTPDEQKKLAGLSGEGTDEFMELYHKARYSDEECTEEDVEKMKNYK